MSRSLAHGWTAIYQTFGGSSPVVRDKMPRQRLGCPLDSGMPTSPDPAGDTGNPYQPPEHSSLPPEEEPPFRGKRPRPFTILCILGATSGVLVLLTNLFIIDWAAANWTHYYLISSCLIGLACMYGFWNMRRWAAFIYVAHFCVNQTATLLMGGGWTVPPLIGVGLVTGLTVYYYKRMR